MKKILFLLIFISSLSYGQEALNNGTIWVKNYSVKIGKVDSTVIDTIRGLNLYGTTTVWDDLFFPLAATNKAIVTFPALVPDSGYYSFYVDSVGAETRCIIYIIAQMPHTWKVGTNLEPHLHYKHTTAQGTPTFKLKYKWYSTMGTTQKGWKWYTMNTTTGTTDKTMQIVDGSNGGLNGSEITGLGSILICEIYLTATTAATKTCFAYQFDIHYQRDALGSQSEYIK